MIAAAIPAFLLGTEDVRLFTWGASAALVVAATVLSRLSAPKVKMVAAAVFLGDVSYSLYLLHTIVYGRLVYLLKKLGVPLGPEWLTALIMAVVAIVAAIVSYWFVEKPVTKVLRKWTEKRRAVALAV